jgi:TPR repeat protein
LCYHQGKGFPEDEPRANASDYAKVLYLRTLAANQGLHDAQFALAGMHSNGFGAQAPDQETAFTLFKMAAAQGDKVAQFMVAMFCQRGLGTAVDLSEARMWCELSAAQGIGKFNAVLAKSSRTTHDLNHSSCSSCPCFLDYQ